MEYDLVRNYRNITNFTLNISHNLLYCVTFCDYNSLLSILSLKVFFYKWKFKCGVICVLNKFSYLKIFS